MAGSCGTCGAVGQRCCSDSFDRWCTAANAVCDSVTSVCKACGDHLEECCGVTSLSNAVPDTISGCIAAGATCQSLGNRFVCFP
jgi:hypothetical protein